MSLSGQTRGFALHWNGLNHLGLVDCDGSKCARVVEGIRRFHIQTRGWDDIAYSFLICPGCGTRHKGRGWGVRTAANGTTQGNSEWHAVMVMVGGSELLTDVAKREVLRLVEEHRQRYGRGRLTTHRIVRGGGTACPGPQGIAWVAAGAPAPDTEDDMATPEEIWDFRIGDKKAKSLLEWAYRHSLTVRERIDTLDLSEWEERVVAADSPVSARALLQELADVLDEGLQ